MRPWPSEQSGGFLYLLTLISARNPGNYRGCKCSPGRKISADFWPILSRFGLQHGKQHSYSAENSADFSPDFSALFFPGTPIFLRKASKLSNWGTLYKRLTLKRMSTYLIYFFYKFKIPLLKIVKKPCVRADDCK